MREEWRSRSKMKADFPDITSVPPFVDSACRRFSVKAAEFAAVEQTARMVLDQSLFRPMQIGPSCVELRGELRNNLYGE
jgi:hypothetical protein